MVSALRNFKNIFRRLLLTIILRPEMLKFHPYTILTGNKRLEFVIYRVLTSEEKELLPFFTHFFLSMGAGSKSYREMDTAMELHTGSMGASIHMYVTII